MYKHIDKKRSLISNTRSYRFWQMLLGITEILTWCKVDRLNLMHFLLEETNKKNVDSCFCSANKTALHPRLDLNIVLSNLNMDKQFILDLF